MELFFTAKPPDADIIRRVANVKRYYETLECDPDFRVRAADDPVFAAKERGILISREAASYALLCQDERTKPPEDTALYNAYLDEKKAARQRISKRAQACRSERFNAWRSRQYARCDAELGAAVNARFAHIPFVIELSSGCSVGCDFCALSAQKLRGVFRATNENKRLFQDILGGASARFGAAVADSILYYATEPLDNPDYIAFAKIFLNATGRAPILTTAVALRDIPLTRAAIAMRGAEPTIHRFSLLSLEQFRRASSIFSPEETLFTELMPRYREASVGLVRAGRALHAHGKAALFTDQGTVACISGFIVNLAERKVRLSTPCRASDACPNGAKELDLGSFDTAQELMRLIDNCIESMESIIGMERPIRLEPFLHFNAGALENSNTSRIIVGDCDTQKLLEHISSGESSGAELIEKMTACGVEPLKTQLTLQSLYMRGLISEAENDI